MRVVVLAPHPDDESIGCGGMLCLHAGRGDRVVVIFLTSGELGLKGRPKQEAWDIREAEARQAASVLGVAQLEFLHQSDWTMDAEIPEAAMKLRPILEHERPDRIYLPHDGEDHPDHRAAMRVLRDALPPSFSGSILAFEVWSPLASVDIVEDVSSVMSQKLRAIRCYHSQVAERRYDRAIAGLNRFRGIMNKCAFAEAFRDIDVRTLRTS